MNNLCQSTRPITVELLLPTAARLELLPHTPSSFKTIIRSKTNKNMSQNANIRVPLEFYVCNSDYKTNIKNINHGNLLKIHCNFIKNSYNNAVRTCFRSQDDKPYWICQKPFLVSTVNLKGIILKIALYLFRSVVLVKPEWENERNGEWYFVFIIVDKHGYTFVLYSFSKHY